MFLQHGQWEYEVRSWTEAVLLDVCTSWSQSSWAWPVTTCLLLSVFLPYFTLLLDVTAHVKQYRNFFSVKIKRNTKIHFNVLKKCFFLQKVIFKHFEKNCLACLSVFIFLKFVCHICDMQGGWVFRWASWHDTVWRSILQSHSSRIVPDSTQSLCSPWQRTAPPPQM